jgi:hypothetical protein
MRHNIHMELTRHRVWGTDAPTLFGAPMIGTLIVPCHPPCLAAHAIRYVAWRTVLITGPAWAVWPAHSRRSHSERSPGEGRDDPRCAFGL